MHVTRSQRFNAISRRKERNVRNVWRFVTRRGAMRRQTSEIRLPVLFCFPCCGPEKNRADHRVGPVFWLRFFRFPTVFIFDAKESNRSQEARSWHLPVRNSRLQG